ncbi:MAG: DUF6489 family protein [Pseudomonadota bacterium]|nr:DUF6489 family protein [Pseudomonadota bacterium]
MKFTVNVECTPEEARAFMGLPDVQPMQEALMKDMQQRIQAGMNAMDPETIMKAWMPAGMQGAEQMQKMFWSHFQNAFTGMTNSLGGGSMGSGFGGGTGSGPKK